MKEIVTLEDAELQAIIQRLNSIFVSTKNITKLEGVRADANKKVKEVKDAIAAAKKEYLKPFDDAEKEVLAKIKPLEIAIKEFSDKVLEAKKTAFKAKVEDEWKILSTMDENGLIAPFDAVYDPSWYQMPEKEWKPLLIKAIKKYLSKDDEVTVYLRLYCTRKEASQVETYLIENRIAHEKEIL